MNNDAGYTTWINNLMTGTISAEEQAMRAKFRAIQAAGTRPVTRQGRHAGTQADAQGSYIPRHVTRRGHGDDELTTITCAAPAGW